MTRVALARRAHRRKACLLQLAVYGGPKASHDVEALPAGRVVDEGCQHNDRFSFSSHGVNRAIPRSDRHHGDYGHQHYQGYHHTGDQKAPVPL